MDIIGTIFIIIFVLAALCIIAAAAFFFGPAIILKVADLAERIEDKKQEWRELIDAGKGDR